MVIESKKIRIKSRSLTTGILMILMLSGTVMTAASAYVNNIVYGQQQQATLNVSMRVVCVPNIPNCPTPSQFSIQVTGNNPVPSSFDGSSSATTVNLGPGNYQVNVATAPPNPPGLSRTLDLCNGQIGAGQTATCEIVATYFPPSTLRVVKIVQCPFGVVCPQPSSFTLRVNGTGAVPNTFTGSSAGTVVTLGPGIFNVTEVRNSAPNPPGLVLVPDTSDCNGVISGTGETRQCTVINRYLSDLDGDGLPDTWESNGIDRNNDGIIDYRIPGADPRHKNMYIEVDYMNLHRPWGGDSSDSSIQDIISAFASAPVSNPDVRNGITLMVQLDNNITHQDIITLSDVETTIKDRWFGTDAERESSNAANLLAAKRLVFHYAVFAHEQPGGFSGIAQFPGMDTLMTTGGQGFAEDPLTKHRVGTGNQQAFNFMHELGHNINLGHGGNERFVNCKPNYISIMNYMFSLGQFVDQNRLDFSRSALLTLDKSRLNEQTGFGQSVPTGLTTLYNGPGFGEPFRGPRLANAGTSVDFNFNSVIDSNPVSSDINGNIDCGIPGPSSAGGILNGFNDWGSPLLYVTTTGQLAGLTTTLQVADGLVANQAEDFDPTEELTFEDIVEARLTLLEGIDNAIVRLGGEINTFDIFEDLQLNQLDTAIEKLLQLKAQVIDEFGQEAANREVVPLIDNLVGVLEKQKFPTPPPNSSCGPGSGNRVITGTPDPDTLIGTAVNNLISGLAGDDRINGCAGNDSINGNTDDDGIAGGPGNDALDGSEGDDVIQGGEGNDLLAGGPGINVLTGGPGRDSFVCSADATTTVTDFVPGTDTMSGPCILADATQGASISIADNNNSFNAQDVTTTTTTPISTKASSMPLEVLPMPLPD